MADHGELEYATATGNDYKEHEGTYGGFLHLVVIAIANVVTLLLGLTVGGVLDHWLPAAIMIIFSVIGTLQGLISGSKGFSAFILVLAFLTLAFYGLH
jgi:uncharacterized protein (DUF983 family)